MEATGERYVPEHMSGELIEAEHQARYRLAMQMAAGRDVLDAACGVGWGSALLKQAGARSVHGLDIAPDAIQSARDRAGDCEFVIGDLMDLPYPDDSFDLVACFETIEHVEDPMRALDEIRRVLRPGGFALISSPNPDVYPAGNPFHVRELAADELRDAASERFSNVSLWRQYGLLGSALYPGSDRAQYEETLATTMSVVALGAGQDPYSLVVAGDDQPPELLATVVFGSADEVEAITEEARRVQELRSAMDEEQTRIVAEREFILDERSKLLEHCRALEHRIANLEQDRDRVGLLLMQAEQRIAELVANSMPSHEGTPDSDSGASPKLGRRGR